MWLWPFVGVRPPMLQCTTVLCSVLRVFGDLWPECHTLRTIGDISIDIPPGTPWVDAEVGRDYLHAWLRYRDRFFGRGFRVLRDWGVRSGDTIIYLGSWEGAYKNAHEAKALYNERISK